MPLTSSVGSVVPNANRLSRAGREGIRVSSRPSLRHGEAARDPAVFVTNRVYAMVKDSESDLPSVQESAAPHEMVSWRQKAVSCYTMFSILQLGWLPKIVCEDSSGAGRLSTVLVSGKCGSVTYHLQQERDGEPRQYTILLSYYAFESVSHRCVHAPEPPAALFASLRRQSNWSREHHPRQTSQQSTQRPSTEPGQSLG